MVVQYPNRFKINGESKTIEPDFGIITESGTPINRAYLLPIEQYLAELPLRATGTATLSSSSWSGPNAQGYYYKTVTISGQGITSSSLIKIGRNYNLSDAAADELMQEAWNLLKAETVSNGIRFYAKQKPSVSIPFTWELLY